MFSNIFNTNTDSENVKSVVLNAKLQLLQKILPSEFTDEMIYTSVTLGIWDSLIEKVFVSNNSKTTNKPNESDALPNTKYEPKRPGFQKLSLGEALSDQLVEDYILSLYGKADPSSIDKFAQRATSIVDAGLYTIEDINEYLSSRLEYVKEKYGIVCPCPNCTQKNNKSSDTDSNTDTYTDTPKKDNKVETQNVPNDSENAILKAFKAKLLQMNPMYATDNKMFNMFLSKRMEELKQQVLSTQFGKTLSPSDIDSVLISLIESINPSDLMD